MLKLFKAILIPVSAFIVGIGRMEADFMPDWIHSGLNGIQYTDIAGLFVFLFAILLLALDTKK